MLSTLDIVSCASEFLCYQWHSVKYRTEDPIAGIVTVCGLCVVLAIIIAFLFLALATWLPELVMGQAVS